MSALDTPPAPRGRPRDPRRDEAIYDAAITLCAEVGFDGMTLEAVAARAGVSKPTIYRRCPEGKAQLVAAAIAWHQREAKPQTPDTGSLRGDLLHTVRDMVAHLSENAQLAAGLVRQLRESAGLREIFREHVIEPERARWTGIVERAEARGELAPGAAPSLFPDVAPSLIHGRVTFPGDPLDEAFVTELVDRVLLPILNLRNPKDPS
jgi:AcrR family transcriptional regulator